MNAKLIIDGCEVNIGIELLGAIASSLVDDKKYQDVFHKLAQSPSANIRQEIAYKDEISTETASLLLSDKDSAVLDRILRNETAKSLVSDDFLKNIIENTNEEVLKIIAQNLESYDNIDMDTISKILISLDNPAVKLAMAENYSMSKKILKELAKDTDPDVASAATKTLG